MTEADLKQLLDRVQSWPKSAQDELVAVMDEIEVEFQCDEYVATDDELRVIDEAIATLDAGAFATESDIKAVFAKYRRSRRATISH